MRPYALHARVCNAAGSAPASVFKTLDGRRKTSLSPVCGISRTRLPERVRGMTAQEQIFLVVGIDLILLQKYWLTSWSVYG